MAKVTVRRVMADDDEPVGELLVRAFVETYARKMPDVVVTEHRKQSLRDTAGKRAVAVVLVAEVDGGIAGTVALWPPGAEGSEAWLAGAADLRHLAVDERHRDGSVSSALLDAAESEARALGATALCLHVRQGAHGVRRLYEGRGYRRDSAGDLDRRPEIFLEAFRKALPGRA
jgi:GNAT superfamily N-acetyltransferase